MAGVDAPKSAMTIRTALLQGHKLLEDASISPPRLTAEVLLAYAIGCERAWLYAHSDEELRELWWIHYGRYLHQRLQGTPTQYITGHQEFFGRDFRVTPDVLIPRPETEHLIEAALPRAHGNIVDIGAGSGAIAITLASESGHRPLRIFATDISPGAIRVAAANAKRLNAQVNFIVCDLASALADHSFDLVVSNPPYVPIADSLPREVREHEPALALFAGQDGLEMYRRIVPEAERLLKPGGWLLMELGFTLSEPVRAILENWTEVETIADLAGIPRVIAAQTINRKVI
jgi:release factor glutamine methyltransferase